MYPIPYKGKGGGTKIERWSNRSKVVQMFHWVHTETTEWFNVRIAVVDRMDVGVQSPKMNQSMSEVKLNFAVQRNQNCPPNNMCYTPDW